MNEISVFMGIVDIIPVVIFLIANLKLMDALHNKLNYQKYAILSSGAYMLFFGGICKIIWKFLYAFKVCDYTTLSECFFPMQSIGFILLCVGAGSAIFAKKLPDKNVTLYSSTLLPVLVPVIPVVTTHMPFLLVTLIAMTVFYIILSVGTVKLKHAKGILWLVLSYAGMLCNCFVGSAADKATPDMIATLHWIAELSHIFAEVFLLICITDMIKHGLKDRNAFVKEKTE